MLALLDNAWFRWALLVERNHATRRSVLEQHAGLFEYLLRECWCKNPGCLNTGEHILVSQATLIDLAGRYRGRGVIRILRPVHGVISPFRDTSVSDRRVVVGACLSVLAPMLILLTDVELSQCISGAAIRQGEGLPCCRLLLPRFCWVS